MYSVKIIVNIIGQWSQNNIALAQNAYYFLQLQASQQLSNT